MRKRALITGISGFAGSYLADHLQTNNNFDITGTYYSHLATGKEEKGTNFVKVDLRNQQEVLELLNSTKPDLIFHLAALASPADSVKNPIETFNNNVNSQINLLEAVKTLKLFNTRILIVSSADVYGAVSKKDLPIDEETKLLPTNVYAVSKIAQDFLGFQYYISHGLKIIRARPFNHIGPRQSEKFVVAAFAKKIAEIEKKNKEKVLKVGNLEAKRDFTDVRDMVKAYSLLLEKGVLGEVYNIGSGVSYKISDILKKLLSFSKLKIEVEIDSNLLRPTDAEEILCDTRKFESLTNWKPTIPMKQTLRETLDYWRAMV